MKSKGLIGEEIIVYLQADGVHVEEAGRYKVTVVDRLKIKKSSTEELSKEHFPHLFPDDEKPITAYLVAFHKNTEGLWPSMDDIERRLDIIFPEQICGFATQNHSKEYNYNE
jgi:hypothetical protein